MHNTIAIMNGVSNKCDIVEKGDFPLRIAAALGDVSKKSCAMQ
jgi:hypothetical protein